jgi:hypothetical protein
MMPEGSGSSSFVVNDSVRGLRVAIEAQMFGGARARPINYILFDVPSPRMPR